MGEAAEVRRTLEDLRAASRDQEDALATAHQATQKAERRIVELEAGAAKDREILAHERAQLEEGRRVFRQEFESLAHRIFEEKHVAFDARSQEGLRGLLAPFREQLEAFRTRVDEVHTENVQGHTSLKGELERIRELNQQITAEALQPHPGPQGRQEGPGDLGGAEGGAAPGTGRGSAAASSSAGSAPSRTGRGTTSGPTSW